MLLAPNASAQTDGNLPVERPTGDEAEREPPVELSELSGAYPDLETSLVPPLQLTLILGSFFQVFGVGVGAEGYPTPWLRVGGSFVPGATVDRNEQLAFSQAFDAVLGLRLVRWLGEGTVEFPAPEPRFRLKDEQAPRARIPVAHTIEFEGGVISGYLDLYRCTANCGDPNHSAWSKQSAGTQLVVPFAGFQYQYFGSVRSNRRDFRRKKLVRVAVDAVFGALNPIAADLTNPLTNHTVARNPLGGRVSFTLPPLCGSNGCAGSFSLMVGYMPSPGMPMLAVGFGG